jgi:PhoH-like ATPase
MKKNYVLDTNVLLHDPHAIFSFEDNNVVVPVYVIEEIDTFKKQQDELGRNARSVSREIDRFRAQGSLSTGVALPSGGTLRVLFATGAIPESLRTNHQKDDQILAVAEQVNKSEVDVPTIFVTMDTNLRIRADALGVKTQDFEGGHVSVQEVYTGNTELTVEGKLINELYKTGRSELPSPELVANQFVTLLDRTAPNHSALARVDRTGAELVAVKAPSQPVWGIKPRNREQIFAMNLLLDDQISLVTLAGKAGTGKTLLAVACGLHKVTDDQKFERLLVSRPIFPLGKDIGFLPGTVEEKLNPWMQPIHDSIDFLLSAARKDKDRKTGAPYGGLQDLNILQVEPLTYIRGRSIPHQYMIVDEAQNLTPHEVKTILTRAGEGTKIVLTGDPYQIDHPYLDSLSNGLAYTIARFRDVPIAGTMTLNRGERSELAEIAANRL